MFIRYLFPRNHIFKSCLDDLFWSAMSQRHLRTVSIHRTDYLHKTELSPKRCSICSADRSLVSLNGFLAEMSIRKLMRRGQLDKVTNQLIDDARNPNLYLIFAGHIMRGFPSYAVLFHFQNFYVKLMIHRSHVMNHFDGWWTQIHAYNLYEHPYSSWSVRKYFQGKANVKKMDQVYDHNILKYCDLLWLAPCALTDIWLSSVTEITLIKLWSQTNGLM